MCLLPPPQRKKSKKGKKGKDSGSQTSSDQLSARRVQLPSSRLVSTMPAEYWRTTEGWIRREDVDNYIRQAQPNELAKAVPPKPQPDPRPPTQVVDGKPDSSNAMKDAVEAGMKEVRTRLDKIETGVKHTSTGMDKMVHMGEEDRARRAAEHEEQRVQQNEQQWQAKLKAAHKENEELKKVLLQARAHDAGQELQAFFQKVIENGQAKEEQLDMVLALQREMRENFDNRTHHAAGPSGGEPVSPNASHSPRCRVAASSSSLGRGYGVCDCPCESCRKQRGAGDGGGPAAHADWERNESRYAGPSVVQGSPCHHRVMPSQRQHVGGRRRRRL